MKKAFLLFSALLIAATSFGQDQFFRIGPKVGVSSSNINVKEGIAGNTYNLRSGDAKLGLHVGAFARVSVLGIYVQPEVLFTSAGGRVTLQEAGQAEVIKNYTLNKLDVPVMFGNKFANFFRVQVGPVFSMLLSENVRENGSSAVQQVRQDWRNAAVGYQAGIGFDIGKLVLDLKYEGNLSKLGDNISVGGNSFNTDLRNNQFILSLGWSLL
jgi:hypothetical protein